MKTILFCIMLWTGLSLPGLAQTAYPKQVIANSQIRMLPRSANGRDYQLYVELPASYQSQPDRHYPVLYVCDGHRDSTLLYGLYGNLIYDEAVPEFIIVGLSYAGDKPDYGILRRIDYTPVPEEGDAEGHISGHAREFLEVVQKEIIPFIEREYRVDAAYRVLAGGSLGGLFALYAMLERPGLFQAYIASSPAVDWAGGWLLRREFEYAARRKDLPARLFVSGASEEWPQFLKAIQVFNEQIQSRHYTGLRYKWRLVEGERHAGTKAESYNRGVRFAFAPLAPKPSEK